MKDPYKVLGISRDATDDEVKKAYRELARKYHPDNYAGNPLADLVEEKMKDINEAYDQIQKERASGRSSSTSGYSDAGGQYEAGESRYPEIRRFINNGRYSEAELVLNSVSESERDAEWNFLKGCVLIRRGAYFDAVKYFETACYMDPSNQEYKAALDNIKRNNVGGARYSSGDGDMVCNICSSLICADCMCRICCH